MTLYRYVKKKPSLKQDARKGQRRSNRRFPLTSSILMTSGFLLILWVAWPIVSFELLVSPKFTSIVRPIPDDVVVQAMENQFGSILGSSNIDYTKASNWFPKSPPKKQDQESLKSFTISIPKLRIKNATAIVAGEDLNKSLIHYGGTALPGEYGNTVIFGHSVLPAFYNPENYLTIFSTLPTLKEGDKIIITADNVSYKYVVSDMKVVSPDDVSVLEQRYDWSYLSLVTCVPPGTYWKRLIVRAKLERL